LTQSETTRDKKELKLGGSAWPVTQTQVPTSPEDSPPVSRPQTRQIILSAPATG
jgi:hypothetical protein